MKAQQKQAAPARILHTVHSAAAALNFSPNRVRDLIRHAHLRSVLVGNTRMVSQRAIEAFVRRAEQIGYIDVRNRGHLPRNTTEGGATQVPAVREAHRRRADRKTTRPPAAAESRRSLGGGAR